MKRNIIKLILILALVPILGYSQTYTNQATVTSLGGGKADGGNLQNFVVVGETIVTSSTTGGNNELKAGFIFKNTDELFLLPPANLRSNVVSETEMALTWFESPFGAEEYEILRSTDGLSYTSVATVAVGNSSYTDTGLTPNTLYFYRVRAINQSGGESPSTNTALNATFSGTLEDKWSWLNRADGANSIGLSVVVDPDKNLVISGNFRGGEMNIGGTTINSIGTLDGILFKLDSDGNLIWLQQMGGVDAFSNIQRIEIDELGNIYATGGFESTVTFAGTTLTASNGASDTYILKIDPSGNIIWSDVLGSPGIDAGADQIITNTGDVVLLWRNDGTSKGAYLTKYSISGTKIWEKQITDQLTSYPFVLSEDDSGNLYATGTFRQPTDFGGIFLSNNAESDAFLMKMDHNGDVEWVKQSAGANAEGRSVTVTDDAVVIAGSFVNNSLSLEGLNLTHYGERDIFLAKYDFAGNLLWAKSAGGAYNDIANTILSDNDGGVFVAGGLGGGSQNFEGETIENGNLFLANYNRQGQVIWADKVEGDVINTNNIVDISTDGSNVHAVGRIDGNARFGTIDSPNGTERNLFVGSYQAQINCDVPTNLVASAITDTQATLQWDELDNTDVYDIRYRLKGNTMWSDAVDLSEPTLTLNSLESGMIYQVQVRQDCAGPINSDWSETTEFETTGAASCPTPEDLTAAINGQDATLSWSDAGADSYTVRYRIKGTTTWELANPEPTTNSLNLIGLESGTTYQFRVKSNCTAIESPFSPVAEFTTDGPPVCELPTGIQVSGITDNSADISWTASASNPDSYDVRYGVKGGAGFDILNSSTNTATIEGLSSGTTYRVLVRSVCSTDGSLLSVYTEAFEFTTTGDISCDVPEGITVSNVTDNTANISWNTVSTALTYDVRYRISGNAPWELVEGVVGETLDISGLFSGTIYQVRVRSVCSFDGSLRSVYSDIEDFTTTGIPACEIPSGFNVTEESTPGDVTISWNASSGALQYELRYRVQGATGWNNVVTTDDTPSLTLNGLAQGVNYIFAVRTLCSSDGTLVSAYSPTEQFEVTVGAVSCDTPENVSISALGDNTATVTWDAVSSALRYGYRYRVKGSTTWINKQTSGDAVLSGLNAGTIYQFRVRSICTEDESLVSGYSSTFEFTTTGTSTCVVPDGFAVSGITDNGANLDWNDANGALEYEVRYKITGSAGWNIEYTPASSFNLSGLLSGMPYQARIRSICTPDRSFLSGFSGTIQFNTTGAAACEVPSNLQSFNESTSTVDLSWDDANGAIQYEVWYKIQGEAGWERVTTTDNLISLTGLTSDENYRWRVRSICAADNSVRSVFSGIETFFTTTPGTRISQETDPNSLNAGPLFEATLTAYPNPFNDRLVVDYFFPTDGSYSIKVYSSMGQEVGTIFEGTENQGSRSFDFMATDLPAGAYFIKATDFDGNFEIQRVILQR